MVSYIHDPHMSMTPLCHNIDIEGGSSIIEVQGAWSVRPLCMQQM